MSSSTLDSQSSSILGPFTSTFDLTSQNHPSSKSTYQTGSSWTAPFRDGLPTPPSDMTGVAYNAIPPVNHPGRAYGMPSYVHDHHRPRFDSVSSSMMAVKPQTYLAPVSESASAKEAPSAEPAQKKSTGGLQRRIPPSINNTKGSLAEFAAQVSFTCNA